MTFAKPHPPPPPPPCLPFFMQIWVAPSLNPAKVFSDPRPSFGFSVTTDPPFVLVKIKWSPQAIPNDRSLISTDKLEIAAPSGAERFRIVWSISSVYSIENWIHFQVPRLALRKLLPIVKKTPSFHFVKQFCWLWISRMWSTLNSK